MFGILAVIFAYVKLFCILSKYWFLDFLDFFREPILKDLSSETVLITGAANGLGKGVAERLVQLGCTLVLWDVDGAANTRLANELNTATKSNRVHAMKCDLTSRENIYECAKKVRQNLMRKYSNVK